MCIVLQWICVILLPCEKYSNLNMTDHFNVMFQISVILVVLYYGTSCNFTVCVLYYGTSCNFTVCVLYEELCN